MLRRAVSGIMAALLIMGMVTLAFNVKPVKASGAIYIRADGSVEGTDKIISADNVTYYLTDNIFKSSVTVTIPGDVDGDCRVTMRDIIELCVAFGSTRGPDGNYWHAAPCMLGCPHSPNCDIDGNGRVDMGDIIIACDHFGQHYP